jgi:hypothetical protein
MRILPRAPWTERRVDSFDNADLTGLSQAQLWAEKRRAEDALCYLVSRGLDPFAWPPYFDSPRSSVAWLAQRVDACRTASEGRRDG